MNARNMEPDLEGYAIKNGLWKLENMRLWKYNKSVLIINCKRR